MTPTIRIARLEDLVSVLPYQLGYHPTRSLVLASLVDGRLGMVARVDLVERPEQVRAVVRAVLGPLRREGVRRVLLVAYEDVVGESDAVLAELLPRLERSGTEVADVVVVRDGMWSVPTCTDGCCPSLPVPLQEASHAPAVAELVALGMSPLPGRADVDALVAAATQADVGGRVVGAPDADGEDTRAPEAAGRRAAAEAWATLLGPTPPEPGVPRAVLPVDEADRAVAALLDVPFRDALLGWLCPGVLEREVLDPTVLRVLEGTLPRWGGMGAWRRGPVEPGRRALVLGSVLDLVRRVPDDRPAAAAAVCAVAGQLAWCDGDGALARAALERALRLEPEHRLAGLLARLVEAGVRPPGVGAEPAPRHAC